MKEFPITAQHRKMKRDLDKISKRYSRTLTDGEQIAIMSQFLGMVIQLQDETDAETMKTVAVANIDIGVSIVRDKKVH